MILILGASRGIGKFLYEQFSQREEMVAGTYYHTSSPSLLYTDVCSLQSVASLMAMLPDTRHLTVVLAAGIYDSKRLHHSDPDYWRSIIDTNVIGAYNVLRTVLPGMRQEGYGRIILFSSVVPQIGVVGTSAYSTSKAALWGLAKSVSVENASKGITCNCVNLGYSDLGMGQDALSDAFKRDVINSIPSKRLCTGQEILQTVDYLMGTPYVTGTAIDISGGIV